MSSIDKAVSTLEYLSLKADGERITKISKDLNMGLTVTHRILKTLKNRSFVEQDNANKKYSIGWKARLLSITSLKNFELFKNGNYFLEELSKKTGETSNIVIRNGWECIYIMQTESKNSLRVANRVGNRAPLYCTAVGKVFLAYLDDEERQKYYKETEIVPFTPNTLYTVSLIEKQIQEIKITEIGYESEEQAVGEACIAAPIFKINGEVAAALSISAPTSRLKIDNSKRFAEEVLKTAKKISESLGYSFPEG